MIAQYDLSIGRFQVFEKYTIGELHPGIDFGKAELMQLIEFSKHHYQKPFGYIANRINLISIDPMIYLMVKKEVPLLKTMAIVAYRASTFEFAEIEKKFAKHLHFSLFLDLKEAIEWTEFLLERDFQS